MLVQDFLENSAARLPDKTALICQGERLTYAQLDEKANQFAQVLLANGVQRGDRVVVYMPNAAASVIALFGILKAGGVFVIVNHTTKKDKLAYILQNCQAAALLTDLRRLEAVEEAAAGLPSLKLIVVDGASSPPELEGQQVPRMSLASIYHQLPSIRPDRINIDLDLACLIYTSGSTGEPKGVMSDHSNVVFAASSIIEYIGNVEDDIVICLLPLSFDYGLYQLLMTFKFGGTLVLEASFAYPAAILKLMEQERVTGLPGVPTIFSILLQTDLGPYDLSALRYLTNTAAALPPSHILQLRDKFPGTQLFSMYGLTETKRTLYLPPAQLDKRPGSVGIPIPGTEAWLEDDDGTRLPPGMTGELVVRGRHVMRGYWNDPVTSAVRFRPGKLPHERVCYTGDLFRTDDEGYFYFVGRKDDIIKSRGEKVAPKEVENVLYMLPGVVEAAVIGVEDPVLGQAVKAFLVVDGTEISEKQVLAHCRANLEDFMVPKYVEFRANLEKTSSGKIKKTGLK